MSRFAASTHVPYFKLLLAKQDPIFDIMGEKSNPKNSVPLYDKLSLYQCTYFMRLCFWYFLLFIQVLLLCEEYIPSIRNRDADERELTIFYIYFLLIRELFLMCFDFYRFYIFIFVIKIIITAPFVTRATFFALRLIIYSLLQFLFLTYMRKIPRPTWKEHEVTEVRNSKVEDGIFCWRTRSVEGHKPLYVARKRGFHYYSSKRWREFSVRRKGDGKRGGGGSKRGKGLIENLIRW